MKWTGLNELRESFLSFFEEKGHYRMDSFPLVPQDDKSLLLINSGMAPLKKYFLGQAKVPGNRATTCQKCIRTPDIERVGKTSRHGTYFEMLGNFSFGDYFKEDAIAWAWEFLTKTLDMPSERLYCSVFLEDDEAYEIWTKKIGVPQDHMIRLGREDNFWEIGSGPCGPCSEIYFDRGEENGCGNADCAPGCDCDRFVEIWNLVFTQFISDGNGNYSKMEKPNIDTGMGLERLACMIQGVGNLFEVDTVQNIMKHIERIAGVTYKTDEKTDVSLRVITDHIRSTVFMVGDGVAPTNEGRGYVLRRLLRRAARHGRLLGIDHAFLHEVCDTVIDENKIAYPELDENREYIKKVIVAEENRFEKTINIGLEMFGKIVEKMKESREKILSGVMAFKLNDTYGFPLDLITEMLEESGYSVDIDEFQKLMQEQKTRAREDAKKKDVSWEADLFQNLGISDTEFVGYDTLQCDSKLVFVAVDGEAAESASEGDTVQLILEKTPFYAESGGQVGDVGTIKTKKAIIQVDDCRKTAEGYYVHYGTVESGMAEIGEDVTAVVDSDVRRATMRNHTGAHLLQQALRDVLGDHVHQSGSYVDSHHLRFDFSHFEAVKPGELAQVEDIINRQIMQEIPVTHKVMPIEQAKKEGAIALFGEKYGDTVRIIDIAGYSIEFCGGTHVNNTASLGLFKIISESSVAAGIRRIEATTSMGVMELLSDKQAILDDISSVFKINNQTELAAKTKLAVMALKAAEQQIEKLRSKQASEAASGILDSGIDAGGIMVYAAKIDGNVESLRSAAHALKDKNPDSVAVLASVDGEKVNLCVACGQGALDRGIKAGNVVKEVAAVVGGSGGGKPDIAMAGGKDPAKLDDALAAAANIVKKQLG